VDRDGYYKLEAGSCRRTQLVEEAQTSVVLEYVWMCLSDEFIVISLCLGKLIVKFEWIFQR